jgi:hypothetical protein
MKIFKAINLETTGYIKRMEEAYINSTEYRSFDKRGNLTMGLILMCVILLGIGLIIFA